MSWNPDVYEKFKNERSQPFFDLLNKVRPIPKGMAVDLGCGTGELTQILHQTIKADQTTGIDSSPEMLLKSKKFSGNGLEFTVENINSWNAKNKYDLIFSNAALQWCDNHPDLFKRLYEALTPNGQLAVQIPMNHDYPTHTLAAEMSREPKWNQLLHGEVYNKYDLLSSIEEYAHLLFLLGFKKQDVSLKVYGHVLDSREEVIEWVKGSMLTYFHSRLNEQDYKDFLKEYHERLFQILPDEKPFFYPFKRLFLWAEK